VKVALFQISLEGIESKEVLDSLNQFLERVKVKKTSAQLVELSSGKCWSILVWYEETEPEERLTRVLYPADTSLSNEERRLLEALRGWRAEEAQKRNVPRFYILHNSQLVTIAKIQPREPGDLMKIKGFSQRKLLNYGSAILSIVKSQMRQE